jgi:putative endonuclease
MSSDTPWFVYILQCRDNSLYTGITNDLPRRLDEHNHSPRASRYTRARRPVALVYLEQADDRAQASRREYELKQLARDEKIRLVTLSHEHSRELLQQHADEAMPLENVRHTPHKM